MLPALTARPVLPEAATVTVMLPDGAADSDTPNTSLVPCATENVGGFTSSEPPPVPVGGGEVGGGVVGGGVVGGGVVGGGVVGGGVVGGGVPAPLHATPLRVNAVGAVLVPL